MTNYDIIIVGGGLVGLTLACTLAQQTSLSIAVLESQATVPVWSSDHYHHRVSAIALSSQRLFIALDIWDAIQKMRVSPFTQMDVWDANSNGNIHFDSQDIAEPKIGRAHV